jgi:hypothetical protein
VSEDGRYLFTVTRELPADSLLTAQGIDGAPLDVLRCGALQAVVCRVDLQEFGEEALRRNLEDLAWVETLARIHDDVVRAVAARSTVAPMRLVTVYRDDDGVREQVRSIHADLVAALDRVEGCHEWSVKLYGTAMRAPESSPGDEPTTGVAFLQRKREQAAARRTAEDAAALLGRAVHDELSKLAVASRHLASQDARLSGRAEPMLHNGAYLVRDDVRNVFRFKAEAVAADLPNVSVEVKGPWPPYSFAVLQSS